MIKVTGTYSTQGDDEIHIKLYSKILTVAVDYFLFIFFSCGAATQRRSWPPHFWGFLDHTQRRTTVGRTLLDEWSARRRDLYLTTHNTYNRQTPMPPVGFEPTISAGERPQTYALLGPAQKYNKLYIVASCWTIIDIDSRCTDPWTLNLRITLS